jgi:hypothetical protein
VSRHHALAFVEHLARVRGGGGDHRYPDLGTPMQVKMTRLGHRYARVVATEFGDERPDDGPLLFERADVAQQHVER